MLNKLRSMVLRFQRFLEAPPPLREAGRIA